MEKIFIKNRKDQRIAVLLEKDEKAKGLVFVMHGLGGFKEQAHMETFAKPFKEKNYTAVRFDTTNTFGESDGDYQDATVTNYYEDLEDVIAWAKNEDWYREPFVLVGHSLGGISATLYAEKYPEKVKGLALISSGVSGKLWKEIQNKEQLEKWEKEGVLNRGESVSKPGMMKILKYDFVEDIMRYDVLDKIEKITMPALLIVGEKDDSTPLEQQKIFFDALLGKKELHVIEGAGHTFYDKKYLDEVARIFERWIDEM